MAYSPTIQVVDVRAFKDNIIAHIQANQVEALAWANGGRVLPEIKKFYKAPTKITIFPSLTFLQIDHKAKLPNDLLEIEVSYMVEVAIVHGNQETLADLATKYSMAVESMLLNVPETTLNQDSIIDITSTSVDIQTVFNIQGKTGNKFIEIFQTRVTWEIEAAGFAN